MIKHIKNVEEFDNLLKDSDILLDFFATWCGPCRMVSPILEELDSEGFKIQIVKVDVDELPEIAMRYRIQMIPTLLHIKNGEVKNQHTGFMRKDEIIDFCN